MTNEELVYLYQQGDKQAMNKLIEKNMGIIYKLVNKFYIEGTNSIDREDLEQEGTIGLIIAAKRYDFNNPKKANFITYAIYWIHSKISSYINKKNTNEETSLNSTLGENGDIELVDYIEGIDYGFENVEEELYLNQLRRELEYVMDHALTLKEQQILKLRYGWNNNKCFTLKEVGELIEVSYKYIDNIKTRALKKMRSTPWGKAKAIEIYSNKLRESKYNINKTIESISFAEKYLYK